MSRVSSLLTDIEKLSDRRLSRKLRASTIEVASEFIKEAQSTQTGVFQNFRDDVIEYPTRNNQTAIRGGEVDAKKLYNLSDAVTTKMDSSRKLPSNTLSTRYSPDHVGVQARRIADGVYQDPYTNKIYDWNEGFTTEDGRKYTGGHVSLQTDLLEQ